MYHKLRVFELRHITPLIPWERYLSIVLDHDIDESTELVVYASDYFPLLGALLRKTDARFNQLLHSIAFFNVATNDLFTDNSSFIHDFFYRSFTIPVFRLVI